MATLSKRRSELIQTLRSFLNWIFLRKDEEASNPLATRAQLKQKSTNARDKLIQKDDEKNHTLFIIKWIDTGALQKLLNLSQLFANLSEKCQHKRVEI